MIRFVVPFLFVLFICSCGHNSDRPDVSGVEVGQVHIERFDTAFFNLDSNNIQTGLFRLNERYPYFTQDFVGNILGAGPMSHTPSSGDAVGDVIAFQPA